jgi:hypothetical protein
MVNSKKLVLGVLFFMLGFLSLIFAQETLEITTYYPSPYGTYNELRAKRIAIGENYIDAVAYPWGPIAGPNPPDIDLAVEGQVGIGTFSPITTLDIVDNSNILSTPSFVGIRINQNTLLNKWAGLRFDRQGNQKWFIGMNDLWTGGNDNKLRFRRQGSEDAMVIDDSTGQVAIGGEPQSGLLNFAPALVEIINPSTFAYNIGLRITKDGEASAPPVLSFYKTRGTVFGTHAPVHNNDTLAAITFGGRVDLGGVGSSAITVKTDADGAVPSNFIPSTMTFTVGTKNNPINECCHEILRIDSNGAVGIGTAGSTFSDGAGSPDPMYGLHVVPYDWGMYAIDYHDRAIRSDGAININAPPAHPGAAPDYYNQLLFAKGDQALWYNGTYFSWGYGGSWNYFADGVNIGEDGTPIAPPSRGLRVYGSVYLAASSLPTGGSNAVRISGTGGWVYLMKQTSSLQYKDNIRNYQINLDIIQKLRPVRFQWNEKTATPGMEDIGLVAEEVNQVFPDLVSKDESGHPESVQYEKLSVVLLSAFQQQEEQFKTQQREIEELKAQIKAIKNR